MKKAVVSVVFLIFCGTGNCVVNRHTSPDFFIIDSWISGFIYGLSDKSAERRWKSAWKRAGKAAVNDIKITGGLFISDRNRKFFGQTVDIGSRLTYQLPQTILGWGYAQFENTVAGNTGEVRYACGSVVVTGRGSLFFGYGGPAVTLGSFLIGDEELEADPDNTIFQHEYGHYLQSRAMGWAYLSRIAIPSILSEHGDYKLMYKSHDYHPTELDANRRGFLYFNRISAGFQDDTTLSSRHVYDNCGWDFDFNPLQNCGVKLPYRRDSIDYVNYRNINHLGTLKRLEVKARPHDYFLPIIAGFINSYHYNNPRKSTKKPSAEAEGFL